MLSIVFGALIDIPIHFHRASSLMVLALRLKAQAERHPESWNIAIESGGNTFDKCCEWYHGYLVSHGIGAIHRCNDTGLIRLNGFNRGPKPF